MDAKEARSHLFAVKLEEFVAERDRLAAQLKAAGDKTGAAALKKLARPTVNVWALNQVARFDRDYIEWLARTPAGRTYRQELDQLLRRTR